MDRYGQHVKENEEENEGYEATKRRRGWRHGSKWQTFWSSRGAGLVCPHPWCGLGRPASGGFLPLRKRRRQGSKGGGRVLLEDQARG